jgi:hypothetical protein
LAPAAALKIRAAILTFRRNKPCAGMACCSAKGALLIFYREMFEAALPWVSSVEATKAPEHLPVD